jgi:hypothetical protein
MSQATASLPSIGSAAPRRLPHLEALPLAQRRARPKLFYAAIAVATVMVIVMAQLILSIGVSQGAYRIESLQAQKAQLSRSYQAASEKVQTLSSPQNLAANAVALGMVDNSTPVYLRLSDSAVIGSPAPASAAAGSTGQLVGNALTQNLPLVTAPKTTTPKHSSQGSKDAAGASGEQGQTSAGGDGSATPGANQQETAGSPVPWTGALPAPSTH